VSFFEPPPPRREPPWARHEQAPWMGPPDNMLGTPVPLRLLLARTEHVAVAVTDALAYPMGVKLTLAVRRRLGEDDDPSFDPFHPLFSHRSRGGEAPPELLRFGVQLADGRKATTLDDHPWARGEETKPEGPLLMPGGGSGGATSWDLGFWLWPLPPPGPLAFVCEWPAEAIGVSRAETDAGALVAAAELAEELWPDGHASGGGGSVSSRRIG
jgi:hypothetical protein